MRQQLDEANTETQDIIQSWRDEAKTMTMEKLPDFLNKLINDYKHDYGTIVHALSIGSVATMWAMDHSDQGGITGFQASAIMWENIQNWETHKRGQPMKLVMYGDMLYPQYKHKFQKTISQDTADYLRKEAKKLLEENQYASPEVIVHWTNTKNGIIPFGYTIEEG